MNEHVKLLIEDIKKLWFKLDINQKFSIGALLVAMLVVGIFFIFKALCLFDFTFFWLYPMACRMQVLSSPTRDQSHVPCSGSAETTR